LKAIFIYQSHFSTIILSAFLGYTVHSTAVFLANSSKVLRNLSQSFLKQELSSLHITAGKNARHCSISQIGRKLQNSEKL
jgi:hypothetical protein